MKRIITALILMLGFSLTIQAQLLPTNQCESQSACNARPICGATIVNPYSFVTTALPAPVGICGAFTYGIAGNWVYYRFTCYTSGIFNFRLASHDSATINSDLDFAIWDITTAGCAGINTSLIPVACNAAGAGPTGVQTGGLPAANFAPNLNVTAGSTYIIGVSNPSGVNTQGHTMSFAGTTANITDNKKPFMQSIVPFNPCTSVSVIKVKMSEPVRCNQLGVGADFIFSGTTPAFVVTPGVICPGCINVAPNLAPNFGNTSDTATITFASALTPGTYTITAIANAFRDLCSNPDSIEATLVFTVPATFKDTIRSGFDCVALKYVDTVCGVNGTGPYQYKATGGGLPASAAIYGAAIPGCANYSVSGGSQVIYTVRDALGCEKSDTLNRPSVLALGAPNLSASASPPCHDQWALDSISVTSVSGGVGPYTFTLAPVLAGTIYVPSIANPTKWKNLNFFPLAGTIFTVTVTDAYGCTKTGLRNLVNPPLITLNPASITPTNPTCFGDSSGKLCFTGAGGGTPCSPPNLYTYTITPSYGNTTLTTGGSICFNNLPAGNYTITAADCNACSIAAAKILNQPAAMVINTSAPILFSQPTCPLPNLGWYQPTATGGSGAKKYYLFPLVSAPNTYTDSVIGLPTPTPTNKFDSLSAGTYTVMAVDAQGCTKTATFTLALPPLPNIVNVTVNPVPCFAGVGNIVVNTNLSAPPAVSLTYTFLPPTPGMTATASGAGGIVGTYNNVPVGTYDLIVTNSNGCKDTAFGVVMTGPAAPVSFASVVVDSVLCFGSATGTITAQTAGGTVSANSYQYAIKFGAAPFSAFSAPTLAPYAFANLAAGTYTIRTRDHNLCLKDSVVTVYQPTKLNLLIDDIDSTCFGTSNGEICIVDTGGTADYQYKLGAAGAYSAPQPSGLPFCFGSLAAGTYTLFTIDAKGCLDTLLAIVSPIALPVVSFTALPDDTVCIGSSVTLSGTGATLYTWAGVPGITDGNAFIPVVGTTQYTVTGTDASTTCSNTAIAFVRADTLPIISPVTNQIVCNNTSTSAINFLSSAGTTFTWAHDGTGIGLASPGTGNIASFTAINTSNLPIVVTFTVTPTGAPITNCVGNDITFTITINPDAFINLTSPVGTDLQTVCINTAIDPITYQGSGGGAGYAYAGLPPGVTGNAISGTITGIPTVTGVYTYTVTTTGTCAQTSTVGTIDVTPDATISLTSPIGTNAQTVCINSTLTNIDYTFGGTANNGIVLGLPAGVAFVVSGNVITISGSPSVAGLFTYTVTATGTCASITTTGTINVTPLQDPSFNYPGGGTYCQTGTDPAPTITGAAGGTFSASPSTLVINSSTGLVDLSASPIDVYTIKYVTPGPCPDSSTVAMNITLAPCATFNYAVSAYCQNGVNPLPDFVGLCGGGNFTASSGLLIIDPTTGEVDLANSTAGTYTVTNTIVAAGGCSAALDTTVITINPNATINLSSAVGSDAQSVCVNSAIANITYNIGGGGTGGTVAGLPTGVVGNYVAGVFTISGSPSVVGTSTYTITTTGTCGQTSITGTITSTPDATIALSSTVGTDGQTVCVNTSIVDITYAIAGGGTGATFAGLPPGVAGSFSSGTATISGTPSLVGVYTYTVTTTGTCVQTNITGTISVDTNAILTLTSAVGTNAQNVCINSAMVNINYTIGGTGNAGFVTGLPAGVSAVGNPIVISGSPSVAGFYTYTVTATGTCASTTTVGTINVVPLQDPSFSYSPATYCITGTDPSPIITGIGGGTFSATPGGLSINATTGLIDLSLCIPSTTPYVVKYVTSGPCPDSTTFNINIVTSPLAGPFAYGATNYCQSALDPTPTFTAPAVAGVFSSTPGLVFIDTLTGQIDVSSSTPGTYTVKNLIVAAGGCAPDSATTIVTIEPTTVLVDPADQQLCNGTQTTIVNLVSSILGTTYTYTCNGTIGLAANGTIPGGVLNPFVVSNAGNAPLIDTIIITPIGPNGCPGLSHSFTIQVDPTPVITDPANQIVCAGDPTNAVSFVSTVANSIFNWSISNPAIGIAGPPPVNGVPSFIGINAGSTNVTGIVTITATGPAPTFCAATSQSYTYTVQPSATLALTAGSNTQTVCKGSPIANITYTIGGTGNNATIAGLPPGMTYTATATNVIISGSSNPPISVPTAYVYTVTATGTCGAGSATGTITLDTLLNPTFTFVSPTICNTGTAGPNLVVNPGGVFSVTPALGAGSFNTTTGTFTLPVATGGYVVKYVTAGPCKDSTIVAVTVTNAPCAQFSYAAITYCQSGTNPAPVFQPGCSAGGFSFIPAIPGNVLVINTSTGSINLATSNPGTYQVINTILPSGTCPGTADTTTINIVSKPNPVAGIINPAGCFPTCNGSVQITTTGGSPFPGPSYTYAIAGTGTPAISAGGLATSMCAGSVYTITATDAIGCTGTVTVAMIIAPAVSVTAIGSSVTAPGACNGTITATGIGGTPGIGGYVYSISPALVQAPIGQFNNACDTSLAGSNAPCYTVTVTDSKGCTATTIVCIGTLDCIITSQTNVSCNGGTNGSFTDSVSGGVGPYIFSIFPASAGITQTSPLTSSSTNLAAGSYTVMVTDANLIMVTRVVTITQPNVLAFATPVINRPSCFPGCDGTLTAIANGGTNPKTYVIAGPPGSPCTPTQSTPGSFAGLGVGNYTITVTDTNLCVHDTVINIQLSPAPTLALSKVNPTCNGLCNGTISAIGGSGTPPFSFAITSPPGSLCVPTQPTSGNFANLGGGTYTIVITDSKGCNKSDTITLINPPVLTLNAPVTADPLCNGDCNGTVNLSGTGGTGTLTFTLTSGIPQSNTSGVFNSLCAATYTASVTDATGCSASTIITLTNPTSLSWTTNTPTNITCNGANDGIINVVATGGIGVKVYSKDGINFAISGNFNGLVPGTYTITAKDVNGCTLTTVHTLTQPPVITLTVPVIQNVKCNGTNTGAISITAGGGTPGYLYDIVPTVAMGNNTGTFNNLPAGVYAITVTDTIGCTKTLSGIIVTEPAVLSYTLVNRQNVACYGDATGTITVSTQGGTPAITFSINPNFGAQGPSGFFSGLIAGTYVVTATDVNNCSVSTSVTITEGPRIIISNVAIVEPICHGDANGSISFSASGGTGTLNFQLNGGPTQSDTVFNNLLAGNYILTVIDALGCSTNINVQVTEPDAVGAILNLQGANCVDSKDGKAIVIGTGGRGGYVYYITPGLHINKSGIFYALGPGAYVLRVVDTAGCEYSVPFSINPPAFPLGMNITKQDLSCNGFGNEGSATANVSGGTPPYTYEWSTTPVQTKPKATTLYFGYYDVKVIDANGCVLKDTVYIEEGPCCDVAFIPNAFSPNGDYNNDVFRVLTTAGVELIQLEVYNRWGKRVWSTIDYRSGWDGTFENSPAPIDTYHYIYRYKCTRDAKTYVKKGDVTLIR